MSTQSVDTLLRETGLSTPQSSLYRALLRLGPQKAITLSDHTGISRTNTYNVLSELEIKGLVERRGGGRKTIFSALHPKKLEEFLDREQRELNARRENLRNSIQNLLIDYSLAEGGPGIFRFEGKEGMIRVYEELIRDKVTVNSIVDRRLLRMAISDYNPEYIRKRIRHKIHSRVISTDSGPIESDDKRELREVRNFDSKIFPFEMDLKITAKKVVMTTFREDSISGTILIDPEIIRNYSILFEFLWSIARRPS